MAGRGEKMIKYEAPKMEIVTFEAEDVIVTSVGDYEDGDTD